MDLIKQIKYNRLPRETKHIIDILEKSKSHDIKSGFIKVNHNKLFKVFYERKLIIVYVYMISVELDDEFYRKFDIFNNINEHKLDKVYIQNAIENSDYSDFEIRFTK